MQRAGWARISFVIAMAALTVATVQFGEGATVAFGAPANSSARYRVINAQTPGQPVAIESFIVRGKINIFDFYSQYCPPCVRIAPLLEQLTKKREDVVVSKVDINRPDVRGIDWESPAAQKFKLESIPYFVVYDATGRKVAEGREATEYVLKMLKSANLL